MAVMSKRLLMAGNDAPTHLFVCCLHELERRALSGAGSVERMIVARNVERVPAQDRERSTPRERLTA